MNLARADQTSVNFINQLGLLFIEETECFYSKMFLDC